MKRVFTVARSAVHAASATSSHTSRRAIGAATNLLGGAGFSRTQSARRPLSILRNSQSGGGIFSSVALLSARSRLKVTESMNRPASGVA